MQKCSLCWSEEMFFCHVVYPMVVFLLTSPGELCHLLQDCLVPESEGYNQLDLGEITRITKNQTQLS